MASSAALLEAMIRRDRLVLVAEILVVSALAWVWLLLGAGTLAKAHAVVVAKLVIYNGSRDCR